MVKIDKKIVSWKLKTTEKKFKENHAVKRPDELICHIHQAKVKGENWTIIVGLLEDKPYEIFGGLSKFVEIPKKYKDGLLKKSSKGKSKDNNSVYTLSCGSGDDMFLIKDIVSVFENTTQGAFTRMISLSLRHGVPVNFVVEQLQKDKYSDITSFSSVMARVLKTYIPEGTKSSVVCPECGSDQVVFESACMKCQSCLYSRCS